MPTKKDMFERRSRKKNVNHMHAIKDSEASEAESYDGEGKTRLRHKKDPKASKAEESAKLHQIEISHIEGQIKEIIDERLSSPNHSQSSARSTARRNTSRSKGKDTTRKLIK
jgi:hypothetical protein